MYARIGYVSAQLLVLGAFFWTSLKVVEFILRRFYR